MNDNISSIDEEIENLKQKIEALEAENADLKKKVEHASSNSKYYSDLHTKIYADMERIHRILDHLKPTPPRSEEKTEENKWPDTYDLVTRLSIWLGNK